MRVLLRFLAHFGTALLLTACGPRARGRHFENASVTNGVQYLGKIGAYRIYESSGVVASRRYTNVFWTHNDGGKHNADVLFAITRTGGFVGRWLVTGPRLWDWEDVTMDDNGHLLLADTGDNHSLRPHLAVHRIKEPDPKTSGGEVPIEQTWLLSLPNGRRNIEALFTVGQSGYLVSKRAGESAEVYRFALSAGTNVQQLELIAELDITNSVAGAAVSPDKRILALVSSGGAYAYRIDGDPMRLRGLAPCQLTPFPNLRIEGCTFVPDGLLTTSETRYMYLFTNEIFRGH